MPSTHRIFAAALLTLAPAGVPAAAKPAVCNLDHIAGEATALAFRSCGAGPAVLIVPGGPGLDAEYMRAVALDVAAMGYRAVLLEPRGTGASAAALTSASQLTVDASIADIEAVRQKLGEERLILLGHSFGGAVVQAYAARHPDRVGKLVLLGSAGLSLKPPGEPLDGWRARLTAGELTDYDAARVRGDRLAAMKIKFRGSFYRRDTAERFVATLSPSSVNLSLSALGDDYARHYDISGDAAVAPYPVVLLAGDIDWIRGYERQMRTAYPRVRTLTIARAGHFPWLDAPGATRRALRQALKDE